MLKIWVGKDVMAMTLTLLKQGQVNWWFGVLGTSTNRLSDLSKNAYRNFVAFAQIHIYLSRELNFSANPKLTINTYQCNFYGFTNQTSLFCLKPMYILQNINSEALVIRNVELKTDWMQNNQYDATSKRTGCFSQIPDNYIMI